MSSPRRARTAARRTSAVTAPPPLRVISGLLALALTLSAAPITPLRAQPAPPSYEQRLNQASLYMRQELYHQALAELEVLLATPQGATDLRVVVTAAEASYGVRDITKALDYLRVARRLSQSPSERHELGERYNAWSSEYAPVRFESSNALRRGALVLESDRKILNPERREVFERARERLALGFVSPLSLYLPYGSYTANQVPFQLVMSQPMPIVAVPLDPITTPGEPPAPSSSNTWVYVSLGGAVLVAVLTGVYLATADPPPQKALVVFN